MGSNLNNLIVLMSFTEFPVGEKVVNLVKKKFVEVVARI